MSSIEELQARVSEAEERFGLIKEQRVKYSERLVSLIDAIETRLRDQNAEIERQAAEVAAQSEQLTISRNAEAENQALRGMLHSLLRAIEAGGADALNETILTMDSKVSALIRENVSAVPALEEPTARPVHVEQAPQEVALEARGLVREFGASMVAVAGIDLTLAQGEFLTVFGPNGAGKTTLLGMLAGRMRPTRGEIRVMGARLDFSDTEWRRHIGVVSHQGMLYGHLTVEENLRFFGRLFGLEDLPTRVEARLAEVGLADRAGSLVRQLSHGMRQRVALARALLHDPSVVFLDEPYTGLDPHAAGVLRSVLGSLRDGRRTVLMVTHNLTQGLEMSTRLAIQVRGRFAWEGSRTDVDAAGFEAFYHRVVESA